MADSNITKRALAASLKELMEETPFAKISVRDICEKCEMNRKSFYYHFKDKYDLVNWIYQTEFITVAKEKEYSGMWMFISDICTYLFQNRSFYKKALQIEGQNSFFDYFKEVLLLFLTEYIGEALPGDRQTPFYANFFADAFTAAIQRWMQEKEPVEPAEFISLLQACLRLGNVTGH